MVEVGVEVVAAGSGPPEGRAVEMIPEDKGSEVAKGGDDVQTEVAVGKKTGGESAVKGEENGEGKEEMKTEVAGKVEIGNAKDAEEKNNGKESGVKGEENGVGKGKMQTEYAGTAGNGNVKGVEEKPGEEDKEKLQTEDAWTVESGDAKTEEKTEEREKPGKGSDVKEEKNSGDDEKVNESIELESKEKEGEKLEKENDVKEEKDSEDAEKMVGESMELETEEKEGEKPEKENDVKEEKDGVDGEKKVNVSMESGSGEEEGEKPGEDIDMKEEKDIGDGEKVDESMESESEEDKEEKPVKESDVKEENDNADDEKKVDEIVVSEVPKKKRARGWKVSEEGNRKEKKESVVKAKESPRTPAASIERPVRERRSVERLVEVIDKGQNKEFLIEKGRGTPLKDIPNVAYKIGKKKSMDLKFLHQTLFGRRGKAVNFKNHILQFSGFAWHDDDEKQKAKMKDKLDKYVKDALLDICDLLDIPVSRATTKKEDLVVKLLDFMVAPHATTDVILAEKDQQSSKSRKRKSVSKGTPSRSTGSMSDKRKKRAKGEGTPRTEETEDEDEEEDEIMGFFKATSLFDSDNRLPDEDEHNKHHGNDEMKIESEEVDEDDDKDVKKGKRDIKTSSRQRGSARKEKIGTSPKKVPITTSKSPSKHLAEEKNDVGAKVFSRKKRNIDEPKLESSPKPNKKEKATGKRSTGKGKTEETKQSGPSKEELRKTICEILKEVDFNTATFTDILKQLATRYKMDLTSRKSSIKQVIQEELTRLADEAEDSEDDDEDEDENPKSTGKELVA